MGLINSDCLDAMRSMSANSVDTILTDPPYGLTFMGSGTTGIACKNTGRDFIRIEREEAYFKIAEARINGKA